MLNEFLFTKIEDDDIGNIGFQEDGGTCHTAEATLDVLRPVLKITLSAAELKSLDAVKDKCYANKPEPIDALKNNIREAMDEI